MMESGLANTNKSSSSVSVGGKMYNFKSHQCSYCSYSTYFNYLLVRHMRTHTGEKPYSCPHCTYRSSRKDSLKQHLLTHTLVPTDR
ncbi:hypothetical protein Pmani_003342 [Petrolisthes manimaculis]|uniref:C2H2-type domain-containing protein n=1 Tax=Petrolisthes manimaculis TaxID=1843537 RepID=A0AAE1UJJ7_9EUCA|nr:hypothetical protein Pmani_003342 [Petrolisthes manimaculis]